MRTRNDWVPFLRRWRVLSCLALSDIAGVSLIQAHRILRSLREVRSVRFMGCCRPGQRKSPLAGVWYAHERSPFFYRQPCGLNFTHGTVPPHYLWVSLTAGWLRSVRPDSAVIPETVLREEWGWFDRGIMRHSTTPYLTAVPDILWQLTPQTRFRIEVELSHKSHPTRLRRASRSTEDQTLYVLPPGHRNSIPHSLRKVPRANWVRFGDSERLREVVRNTFSF